jgi:predicted nucleotidyltransferase
MFVWLDYSERERRKMHDVVDLVSKFRLCRATQSASYSPKIKVDVIGSKPSASLKGVGGSPTIAFPGR